jgi:hypothetical protein
MASLTCKGPRGDPAVSFWGSRARMRHNAIDLFFHF